MSKLIIWVTGRPNLDGFAKREFKWSDLHGKFIYEGRVFTSAEFNAAWTKAFSNNADLHPQVMVVDVGAVAPVAAAVPSAPPPAVNHPQPVPVQLITVDQAEAVMMRLAPERLKAKPGPKTKKIPEMVLTS